MVVGYSRSYSRFTLLERAYWLLMLFYLFVTHNFHVFFTAPKRSRNESVKKNRSIKEKHGQYTEKTEEHYFYAQVRKSDRLRKMERARQFPKNQECQNELSVCSFGVLSRRLEKRESERNAETDCHPDCPTSEHYFYRGSERVIKYGK